jgi:hypothetical protein
MGSNSSSRPGIRSFNLLYADTHLIYRGLGLGDLFEALESDISIYLAQHTKKYLFVHAGVVAWRGKGIVIPGSSFSGKTELVRAFVEAGAKYYSDEFALFDSKGNVHSFPRPMSLRQQEGRAGRVRLAAGEVGGKSGKKALPVSLVLLTKYEPQSTWSPKMVSRGYGALQLSTHSLSLRSRPKATLIAFARALKGAKILTGTRGDAHETVASILAISKEMKIVRPKMQYGGILEITDEPKPE